MRDWVYLIVGVVLFSLFMWAIYAVGQAGCDKYGAGWNYRAGYNNYCVNENGDIKGL